MTVISIFDPRARREEWGGRDEAKRGNIERGAGREEKKGSCICKSGVSVVHWEGVEESKTTGFKKEKGGCDPLRSGLR